MVVSRAADDELVAVTLSHLLGGYRQAQCQDIAQLIAVLSRYEAPNLTLAPDREAKGLHHGLRSPPAIMRARGVDRREINELWTEHVHAHGINAHLDPDLLAAVFPPEVRSAIRAVAHDGPGPCAERFEAILFDLSRRPPMLPNRLRPGARRLTHTTLLGFAVPLSRLMQLLCDLRKRGHPHPALGRWIDVPSLKIPDGDRDQVDRVAPPRELLRRTARELEAQIEDRLGVSGTPQQIVMLDERPVSWLEQSRAWRVVRLRVLFECLVVLGTRPQALLNLRRRDYVAQHLGPTGEAGPALAVRPAKTLPSDLVRWKALPPGLADHLDLYLVFVDRLCASVPRPDDPLFVSALTRPRQAMRRAALNGLIGGRRPSSKDGVPGACPGTYPLLPKPAPPGTPDPEFLGYSLASLRRAALQLTRDGARSYCEEHDLEMSPEAISEVLLDHAVGSDRYGYADLSTEIGRERWTRVATYVNWEMLWGARGAWRGPRPERVERALREQLVVEDELRRATERIETIRDLAAAGGSGTPSVLDVILVTQEQGELDRRLQQSKAELDALTTDPAEGALYESPHEAAEAQRAVAALEDRMKTPDVAGGGGSPAVVRDWLTVQELAGVAEVSKSTVPRWIKGEHLPFSSGDPRRPWEPDRVPVDVSLGPRRRRVWIGELKPGFIRGDLMRRRLIHALATWPRGWSRDHCRAPLALAGFELPDGDSPAATVATLLANA